jgi:DNA-binding CsgD family transcriptional regulator
MPSLEDGRDEAVASPGSIVPMDLSGEPASGSEAPSLDPVLEGLLVRTARLTGSASVAVSLVDAVAGRYVKAAERGVLCQVGRAFPLDEGATGHAVASRRPVVLDDYARIRSGHLTGRGRSGHRSLVAVPVWWRGDVVAVNLAFRPPGAGFTGNEIDRLEALSQAAAPAIARRRERDPSLGGFLRDRMIVSGGAASATVTETGPVRPVTGELAAAAADLLTALDRFRRTAPGLAPLRVAVVHRADGVRLLMQQEAAEQALDAAWSQAQALAATPLLAARPGVGFRFERVPGWGVALHAELPYDLRSSDRPETPLTERERQVLALVRDGRTDREIAERLGISPRTVEKHVGASLRKADAPSRAAAVATAIERGWLAGR